MKDHRKETTNHTKVSVQSHTMPTKWEQKQGVEHLAHSHTISKIFFPTQQNEIFLQPNHKHWRNEVQYFSSAHYENISQKNIQFTWFPFRTVEVEAIFLWLAFQISNHFRPILPDGQTSDLFQTFRPCLTRLQMGTMRQQKQQQQKQQHKWIK